MGPSMAIGLVIGLAALAQCLAAHSRIVVNPSFQDAFHGTRYIHGIQRNRFIDSRHHLYGRTARNPDKFIHRGTSARTTPESGNKRLSRRFHCAAQWGEESENCRGSRKHLQSRSATSPDKFIHRGAAARTTREFGNKGASRRFQCGAQWGVDSEKCRDFRHHLQGRSIRYSKEFIYPGSAARTIPQFGNKRVSTRFQCIAQWGVDSEMCRNADPSSKRGDRLPLREQVARDETPVAKAWPEEFTVNFTTKSGAADGFLAYDWAQQRQIIYHGANSTYCLAFGTEDPCQMLEVPGGTYVYIPSLEQCFLSNEGVGSLPPEWTTYSEYVGLEEVPGIGLCRSFAFPPTSHVWYETVVGSLPCVFVFPEPTMTFYFEPDTFRVGTPEDKYFDFPDFCFKESDAASEKIQINGSFPSWQRSAQ